MSLTDIATCIKQIFNPLTSNAERTSCYKFAEDYKITNFKLEDLQFLCSLDQEPPVILFGLNCLEYRVKRFWEELSVVEQLEIRECLFYFVKNFQNSLCRNSEGNAVCLVITQIMVHIIKCEWPHNWPSMITELITVGKVGNLQSLIVFDIFRRLSEDVLLFQDVTPKRRRALGTALAENTSQMISFALNNICTSVIFHISTSTEFDEDIIRCTRAALLLLSTLLEWCNIASLIEWKAIEEFSSQLDTVPSIQLLLFILRIPGLRAEAAEIFTVILSKKQSNLWGGKSNEILPSFSYFISFTAESSRNPTTELLNITSSAFSTDQYSDEGYLFLRRWSEFISLLGIIIVENWGQLHMRGQVASNVFELLIQANSLTITHPSKLFASSVSCFFRTIFISNHSELLSLLSNYMSQLLPTWIELMITQPYPQSDDAIAQWIYANCEKNVYSQFLTKTRGRIKCNCLLFAASIWPTEILRTLIQWHQRLLSEITETGALQFPSQALPEPTAVFSRHWEALAFTTDKLVTTAYRGAVTIRGAGGRPVLLPTASVEDRITGQEMLLNHLTECLTKGTTLVDLPSDPELRQHYLGVLHNFIVCCVDKQSQFALKLLMQDFATLRYNPGVEAEQLAKPSNLRCPTVKSLHLAVGVNVFRLVRSNPSAMVPFFDSFCSELNDILTNGHSGLGEQCLLLEVVIYLALRLPCGLDEQLEKLKSILTGVLSQWTSESSLLVTFGSQEDGLAKLLSYFHLNEDPAVSLQMKTDHPVDELATTCRHLRWITSATDAIARRLNAPVSSEQLERVCIPLLVEIVGPAFNLLRTLNELWQPVTVDHCHASMRGVLDLTPWDRALVKHIQMRKPTLSDNPEKTVTIDISRSHQQSIPKLQSFFFHLHESLVRMCQFLLEVTSSRFYSLPTDQIGHIICNYACPGISTMSECRLLQILRHLIIPFVRFCPAGNMDTALVPVMPYLLDALYQKVNQSWSAVKVVSKEEVNEDEAVEEVFLEETVRSLSTTLVELTRTLLAFTGARQRRSIDSTNEEGEEVEEEANGEVVIMEFENSGNEVTPSTTAVSQGEPPIELGPVAKSLFSGDFDECGGVRDDGMLVRVASWLTVAAGWPDSKVCVKAATLLVKIIDYHNPRGDNPPPHATLPATFATRLLIGGLEALRTNGQFLSDVGPPLFNLISRTFALIGGGSEAVVTHLEPILLSALTTCETDTLSDQHLNNIKNWTRSFIDQLKPSSDRTRREGLKRLLQPIIGVPVAEQYKHRPISTLKPLESPSVGSRMRRARVTTDDRLRDAALFSLTDLFQVDQ